ncbi:UTP--glucose-1-phosphate uridylyltransferase [Candidatus Kuenenbacteria bacterium HGW-Kuenenbacteria-1]|uniref:UTP--glucose-1-phosphate uridylyltransferase n=1 Tax=Candidatus Kuenenbacteria bacterium HGW-Kuenenbacteria-1 TaxID=2013812 RepID=A0A2N1UN09_9BACT|nr:MAG: UTP--glucose-1-phosphate uridylyltransferase [Candidatus Kuenenbacteria bacterium HGW-Kuenenbacteria-1]
MQKIRKAIVAVAGTSTRFLPAAKSMPKQMFPIIDKPIIQLVVEELVEAGIEDIILVTTWNKKPLEDYFDRNWALEHELEKAGKERHLKEIIKIAEMANFIYVNQKGPYGNGTPILSAASLVKNEPFIFAFGDDLVKSKTSFTKQMIEDYNKTGHLIMGVQKVPKQEVDRYGIVKLKENTMQIEDIIEKPSIKEAPSQFAEFGRMILNQDIINILKKTSLGKNNELWIIDAIHKYLKKGGEFYAKKVENGEWLTTGDPFNYLKAILKYTADRKDMDKNLIKEIKKLSKKL